MNNRYPPSILIALYTSAFTTTLFALIELLNPPVRQGFLLEMLGVFTATLVLYTFILEFFLYRRLKNLDAMKQQEIQKLKDMEAFRREFIGDVSHELKTPIFAIEGFIETLLDGALDDKKVNRKFLQKAQKHAERLSNLVQDILVITHIESGSLRMNKTKFVLMDLVNDVLDGLAYKFTRKGRNIRYDVVTNDLDDVRVKADKERIDQVLRNLIDNAVKYGDSQGTITIELREYDDKKLLLMVHDEGAGIEPEHLPRLFERFYRVDKSRSREKGGTGLGLAICKHFIEAHKQQIWVESEPGKGTTFLFTLQRVN